MFMARFQHVLQWNFLYKSGPFGPVQMFTADGVKNGFYQKTTAAAFHYPQLPLFL